MTPIRTAHRPETAPADGRPVAPPGLKGLVVADTTIGDVRGEEGFYHYRQYSAPDLARHRRLLDVWHLLLAGHLPDETEAAALAAEVAPHRAVPAAVEPVVALLGRDVAAGRVPFGLALRTLVSHHAALVAPTPTLDASPAERRRQSVALAAGLPSLVAALHRAAAGLEPVASDPSLDPAADFLLGLHGEVPDLRHARALERYWILALDHGFNASTFTARVVTSTGSDLGSAVVAALGALLGPLHGGAPSRVLDTLDAIGDADRARERVRAMLASGERIMGFGHAVYRTADPRSVLLEEVARDLGGPVVDLAVAVEAVVEEVLAEVKPDRALQANVEWYAAVVMDAIGIPRALCTSTFAAARTIGWCVHALEQADGGTLIRPSSRYVGPVAPTPVPR